MSSAVRVVGSGVGRTGTLSLKLALEQLLGTPCYHMLEVFGHPEHVEAWHRAAQGEAVDGAELLHNYGAILHSERADAETWWRSASAPIFTLDEIPPEMERWREMIFDIFRTRFTDRIDDRDACVTAYEEHNARVRRDAYPDRLVLWHPGDGWEPLSRALGDPAPDAPFPHTNTTEEWHARRAARQTEEGGS